MYIVFDNSDEKPLLGEIGIVRLGRYIYLDIKITCVTKEKNYFGHVNCGVLITGRAYYTR